MENMYGYTKVAKIKAEPLTAVLRNAGICVSKSHQVAWKFALLLIHWSPETRATQIRGPLCAIKPFALNNQ
jgi:hypothetical protein